jgi:hypothetical protein
LHKNGANRTIALKLGGLRLDFPFFPQGFPLLCAKLNIAEIFSCCTAGWVVQVELQKLSLAIF